MSYEGDNYNESQWFQGYGQLTQIGMEMATELGRFYRQRYVHTLQLLSLNYERLEIHVRSTDVDRTLLTARLSIDALYPLFSAPPNNFSTPKKLNPVPIHTIAKENDNLLYGGNCVKYNDRVNDDYTRKEFRKKSVKYEEMMVALKKKFGLKTGLFEEMARLADSTQCKETNHFTLPPWTNAVVEGWKVRDFLRDFSNLDFEVSFNRYDNARLRAGLLLADIVENLERAVDHSKLKAVFYYAHDTTVAPLLAVLKAYNNLQPPFISTVLVELYKKNNYTNTSNDNTDDDNFRDHGDAEKDVGSYYVKVLYRNDTAAEPLLLELPGCQVECPLEMFMELTRGNVVKDWKKMCMPAQAMPLQEILLYVLSACLLVCLLLLLLCMVIRCHKKAPYHRYIDVPTDMD